MDDMRRTVLLTNALDEKLLLPSYCGSFKNNDVFLFIDLIEDEIIPIIGKDTRKYAVILANTRSQIIRNVNVYGEISNHLFANRLSMFMPKRNIAYHNMSEPSEKEKLRFMINNAEHFI
jgi:hypothetical protein